MSTFDELNDEEKEIAVRQGYTDLFSSRTTVAEAYVYAMAVADNFKGDDKLLVLAAIHVLTNTYSVRDAKLIYSVDGGGHNETDITVN